MVTLDDVRTVGTLLWHNDEDTDGSGATSASFVTLREPMIWSDGKWAVWGSGRTHNKDRNEARDCWLVCDDSIHDRISEHTNQTTRADWWCPPDRWPAEHVLFGPARV